MPRVAHAEKQGQGRVSTKRLPLQRRFTKEGTHPFDDVAWKKVKVTVRGIYGHVEERDLEFPEDWSDNATSIAGSKYFRGRIGSGERETSVKQMISRVVDVIRGWGTQFGYFDSPEDADVFGDELTHILLHQKAAFNSPVWFNVGIESPPQCSACFILSVKDDMESILDWIHTEGMIFKRGSGSGINLSPLRSTRETLSRGGHSSGPVSFMRGADSVAGMIASGGSTRRAAKMVVLNVDHPDIMRFIHSKAEEEKKVRAFIKAGYNMYDLNNDAWNSIQYQNANNSVRVTDEFMRAAEHDEQFETHFVQSGKVAEEYRARDLMREIAQAAWESGDPGMQYDTTINRWHTCPNSGRINASNPCFTGDTLVSTDRGLIQFEELYRRTQEGERFRVFTHNATSEDSPQETVETTEPTRIMVTGVQEVYKLMFSNGAEIKATKNHRFFTRNRGMVPAADLDARDEILLSAVPLGFENASLKIAYDEAKIFASGWGGRNTKQYAPVALPKIWTVPFAHYMGYLVGDGSVRLADERYRLSSVSAVFGTEEEARELIPEFSALFREWGVRDYQHLTMSNGTVQLRVNRTPIARMLAEIGVSTKKAPHKVVPHSIFQTPQAIQTAFLRGLFTADGCVYDGERSRYVGLGSVSRDLLLGVQRLLLAHGIFSRIYKTVKPESAFSYTRNDGEQVQYQSHQTYDLRISSRSIGRFSDRIGFLTTIKQDKLARLMDKHDFYQIQDDHVYIQGMEYAGKEFTYNLTEPKNHSYIANGFVVANCSEYMHLDDSACNLASINLLRYRNADGTFHVRDFIHTVDIMILAQEIIVDGSLYPTKKITENAHAFRQLGLGYANLGALLMSWGLPYDSEEARHTAGAITALMTGEAYRYSAEIAKRKGPYEGYALNKDPQNKVIALHRDAMQEVRKNRVVDGAIFEAAHLAWDRALALAARAGVRNAQVTVLAPTGTIALMMDCATTGIEPEFALVKTKHLVGGGTMKFVNTTVPQALSYLGYNNAQILAIINHMEKQGTIEGAPELKEEHLAVFDCAVRPANGTRSISWKGHVKMVAAAQPFISGAISKTFNMSHETTVEEIMQAYTMGWKLGLKAFAVYRDGSKAAQPLVTASGQGGTAAVEKPKAIRRRLPATRQSETHKFSIAGHEGYLTYGMYEDGSLGEIFIRMSKQGSTLSGLLDVFAIGVSVALQHGVPLKTMAQKFVYGRFEPAGYTENPAIQVATSITDYIFRYLALRFMDADDLNEVGIHGPVKEIPNGKSSMVPIVMTADAHAEEEGNSTTVREASVQSSDVKVVYADSVCRSCGGMLIQTGTCKTCIQCGTSNGGC